MAKKRSNGDGSFKKLPSGKWQIVVMDGYKPSGKRNMKTFTAQTLAEAKRMKKEYEQRKAAGILTGKDYTFNQWSDIWFENHKSNISPTTQEGYTYTLRILKDHFGNRKMVDIKAYDIEQFLKKLRRNGKSYSSIAQCRGMLFQIFKKAVANDLLMKNPVEFADKMRSGPKKRKEAFTADEIRTLLKELPDDKIGWSIRLLLCTGMRTQEILALEPRHIAQDGSTVSIKQAVVMQKGTACIGPPKSFDSDRIIPVPEIARYCAKKLRSTDKKFIWEEKKDGMPCNPSHFRKKFKEALEAVDGVRVLTPHCCRHTYVSQMQALGVDIETIQHIVGHAEVDMTVHYLHVQEPVKQEAIRRFSEAFSSKGSGTFGNIYELSKFG